MRVGIIAEGPSDAEVLANILKGWLGLDRARLSFLRPDLSLDETDLNQPSARAFSNWEIVKQECVERTTIDRFFSPGLDEERYLVVQIDAAERSLANYNVTTPTLPVESELDPALVLAGAILDRILDWVKPPIPANLRAAICVEEMDAWVLTLFLDKNTSTFVDPKKQLERVLNNPSTFSDKERKKFFQKKTSDQYAELTRPFRKRKELEKAAEKNSSLALFLEMLPQAET